MGSAVGCETRRCFRHSGFFSLHFLSNWKLALHLWSARILHVELGVKRRTAKLQEATPCGFAPYALAQEHPGSRAAATLTKCSSSANSFWQCANSCQASWSERNTSTSTGKLELDFFFFSFIGVLLTITMVVKKEKSPSYKFQ